MQSIFEAQRGNEDLYAVLGCAESSTYEQIKTEYKRLALIHHPDKSSEHGDAAIYEKIKAAYDIIGDPIKRATYDRWRLSGLQIPFADYAKLASHAQNIHWQTLPSQLALTQDENSTDASDTHLLHSQPSMPRSSDDFPPLPVQRTSFWGKNGDTYAKFRNYHI